MTVPQTCGAVARTSGRGDSADYSTVDNVSAGVYDGGMTNVADLAVHGHGSWGGAGKVHAAREQMPPSNIDRGEARYISRCGQRYQMPVRPHKDGSPYLFSEIMHLERCQRCARLAA